MTVTIVTEGRYLALSTVHIYYCNHDNQGMVAMGCNRGLKKMTFMVVQVGELDVAMITGYFACQVIIAN